VQKMQHLGPEIFLDLKFHDIPKHGNGAVTGGSALAWGAPVMCTRSEG